MVSFASLCCGASLFCSNAALLASLCCGVFEFALLWCASLRSAVVRFVSLCLGLIYVSCVLFFGCVGVDGVLLLWCCCVVCVVICVTLVVLTLY